MWVGAWAGPVKWPPENDENGVPMSDLMNYTFVCERYNVSFCRNGLDGQVTVL